MASIMKNEQAVFRDICVYLYMHGKEAMDLKENKDGYMGGAIGGMKGKWENNVVVL